MKFSFEVTTDLLPEEIWSFYADVNKWFEWEDDLRAISLEGDFETGTIGEMTLEDQPPMSFTLTSVIKNKQFIDETKIPDMGTIVFHHNLERVGNKTIVSHSVEFISNDNEEKVENSRIVAQIFSDVPASVFSLIESVK